MTDQQKKKVLFLCTHNSARSQMADGLLRAMHGEEYEAYSTGVVATSVDPRAVLVMKEMNILQFNNITKCICKYNLR